MLAAVLCLLGVSAATGYLVADLGRRIVDEVLIGASADASDGGAFRDLLVYAVLLALAVIVGHVFQFFYDYLKTVVQQRFMHDLREAVYATLPSVPDEVWRDRGAGDVMSRNIGDANAVGDIVDHLFSAAASIAYPVGVGAMLFWLHWRIAASSLAVMLLAAPVVYILSGVIRRRSLLARQARGAMNHFLYSRMATVAPDGSPAISQEAEPDAFNASSSAYMQRNIETTRLFLGIYAIAGIATAVASLFCWLIGGGEILGAEMSLGTMFVLQAYIKSLGSGGKVVGAFYAKALSLSAPAERVYELLDSRSDQEPAIG
jgi:ABC-type multidrug transport system fused ATPase/permease subunit